MLCKNKAGLLVLLALPMVSLADDKKWQNEIELGFLLNRGTTNNTHFDSRYTNQYQQNKLKNKISLSSLLDISKDTSTFEKQKTAERYTLRDNLRYKFDDKNYTYFEVFGQKDQFSVFDYEITESIGLGRKLFYSDKFKWTLEAGPGGHHTRISYVNKSPKHQDELIGHAGSELVYSLTSKAEFSEDITFDIGNDVQKTRSTTALKAKILDKVSLKLSYRLDYNGKLPKTTKYQKHTENLTAVTVTYVF